MHIQTEEVAQQSVAAMADADGLQPGKQSSLLFVEQTLEQKDRGLEFIRRHLERGGRYGYRNRLGAAAGQPLVAAWNGLDCGIEKLPIHLHSRQALLLHEMAQRFLDRRVQVLGQLMGIVALGRLVHERFRGGQQRAVAGEPDSFVRPQSVIVEVSDFGQSIEAPTMGVTGEVIELLQFAKYRQLGVGAEEAFQLGQLGDLTAAEMLAKDSRLEGSGSHNVTVPTQSSG